MDRGAPLAWRLWERRLLSEAESLRRVLDLRTVFWASVARVLPDYTLGRVRSQLYRLGGCDLAEGATLQGCLVLSGPRGAARRLHVGKGAIIAPMVRFGLDADITIGRNVAVGPGTTLHTATHALGFGSRRMQLGILARPIVVEDGVWIGMQSLILPGVTLGHGSVVAAGAVVNESVPPNSLVAGNPATVRETLAFGDR
jgi:acetyltransferase-like isoleucine patch superfamily enzyme